MTMPNGCAMDTWRAPNERLTASVISEPVAHLQLCGSLDTAVSDEFMDYAKQSTPYHKGWQLIDITKLNMLTSSGAGVLIRMASAACSSGGGLALVAPSGMVRQAIGFMRLDLVIDTFDTLEQAVEHVERNATE